MEFLKCERDGDLLIVTMSRGKANALNPVLVDELIEAFQAAAAAEDVKGVVLASDRPRFFSSGFDIAEVFGFDREPMSKFFGRFIDCYEIMFNFRKPLVAAVSGHAFAGGAVLALACYARVMAAGEFGFALNEVNLGMVVPPGFIRMAIHAAGSRHARTIVVEGRTISPAQAQSMGLADDVVEESAVLERAKALALDLAAKPANAWWTVRKLFVEAISDWPVGDDRKWIGEFVEHWFSPDATARKEALIQSLKR